MKRIVPLFIASIIGGVIGAAVGLSAGMNEETVRTTGVNLRVEEESQTTKVVEEALPSVVSIVITKDIQAFNQTGSPPPQQREPIKQQVGGGSGFIVGDDGLILTNRHVVGDQNAEYTVILDDEKQFTAEVLARDTVNDLALIKIDAKGLPALSLGDSETLKIGQSVIAIGYTLSQYKNTVTKGVISGIGRRVVAGDGFSSSLIEGALQTDAAINPGNSGGPLLDLSGRVIGINTAVSSQGQLIGFAIPVNEAKRVIESVKEHGRIIRPWLGVRYISVTKQLADANKLPVDYGALIVRGDSREELSIVPGSPADKAGLEENDIILEIAGIRIDENHSLARIVAQKNPGDKILLKVLHDGEERTLSATLEERKE